MFHIFRTKKPVNENESQLVGRTPDPNRAFEIADLKNRSEIKTARTIDKLGVQGNREITEVFTTEELKSAGWSKIGQIPE